MDKVKSVEEGVNILVKVSELAGKPFEYIKGANPYYDEAVIDGKKYPLFAWRFFTKFNGIKNTITGRLGDVSTLRTSCFAPNTDSMKAHLFREFDLAEFWLGSKIKYVMGYGDERAANFIVKMENDAVASFEMSTTMPKEADLQGKHTVYTTNGLVSDMVVDNVIRQELVHVYNNGKDPTKYSEIDTLLYGLSLYDQDKAHAIFGYVTSREDGEYYKKQAKWIEKVVDGAMGVLNKGVRYYTEEDK